MTSIPGSTPSWRRRILGASALLLATVLSAGGCSERSGGSSFALGSGASGPSTLSVVMTSPPDGATDVSGSGVIAVVFSDRVDPLSLTDKSFQVFADGQPVPGRIAAAGERAMFRVAGEFEKSLSHEVVLTDEIRDARGRRLKTPYRFSFATEALEPFDVDSTFPSAGQQNVSLDVVVDVRLSRPVDATSVKSTSFRLEGPTGAVSSTVDVQSQRIRLRPRQLLAPETAYTVTLDGSIQAPDGSRLGEDRVWSFRTDRRYLEIQEVSPEDGGEGTPDLVVEVRFDQELDPASVHEETFYLKDSLGDRVPGEASAEGKIARFRPSVGTVPPEARFEATVTTGIRAQGTGDSLRSAERWSFAIIRVEAVVFLAEDRSDDNKVSVYLVSSKGLLVAHPASPFETRGAGGSSGRDALSLSTDAQTLFVANAGSGDVTSFAVGEEGGLQRVDGTPFSIEGGRPSALEVHPSQPLLYVASARGAESSIAILEVAGDGSLSRAFDPVSTQQPGPVVLVADATGERLFVGFESSPRVGVFTIESDGSLSLLGIQSVSGGSTTYLQLNRRGTRLYQLDATDTLSVIYGYDIRRDGTLEPIAGSPFSNAPAIGPSASMFTRYGQLFYVADATADVTIFEVGPEGALTQIADSPFNSTGGSARLLAGAAHGSWLYLVEESPNVLRRLAVDASGGLTRTKDAIAISPEAVPAGIAILDHTGDGLIAHWPLDGDGLDLSVRDNHLDLESESFDAGPRGGALALDGVATHGVSRQLSGLEGDAPFSTAFWMQAEGENSAIEDQGRHLLGWGRDKTNEGTFIGYNGTQQAFEHGFSPSFDRTSNDYRPGIWYHVAQVYDGRFQRLFVDGVMISEREPGDVDIFEGPFTVGVDSFDQGRYFQGRLDDVRVYDRLLAEKEILDLSLHPKVWMALNEGEGTVTADASGNGSQGVLRNGPVWTEGPTGNSALQLDGINDHVRILHRPTHSMSTQLTMAAWIKVRAFGAWDGIVAKGTSRAPYSMQLWSDGALRVSFNADAHVSNSNALMKVDTWYHVAITYDGANVRFYIDGKLDSNQPSVSLTIEPSEEPLVIGCDFQGGDEYFDGIVDDVRLYQRALTSEQIAALALGH